MQCVDFMSRHSFLASMYDERVLIFNKADEEWISLKEMVMNGCLRHV